ncbi:hypothetical protein COV19_01460 [Candidatus Woesearchaeota archaeon CG10_big_fil_rev_8_21_14_0_10_44_13]|nr:MAG: hypothetical protein COV19_01460 [Candidatus Woesearchaeota archaeon CG10_big_fil_rev_8_21_14_0_10_44_13]
MAKSALKIIALKIVGFIIFLILLGIANIVVPNISGNAGMEIISFMNSNLFFFFVIMVVDLINELFWSFYFPFNILAPITGSLLSILIITLIYKLVLLIPYSDGILMMPFALLYILVPVIVLIAGYILILIRGGRPKHVCDEEKKICLRERWEMKKRKLEKKMRSKKGKKVEWEDIGDEFKLVLYNLGKGINELFEGKKRK